MRGDWIHDWVRVEMEYRAGTRPAVRLPGERPPSKAWQRLWTALVPSRRVEVRHP
ncbi:hypothetical protein [Amycolatopsis sp. cmx-4-61]|uniref:hypothetical protein n=1 Tax=Amycolatopsis sp. cmx-4-61 TaxID=2790937 RepID=UPI00397D1E62